MMADDALLLQVRHLLEGLGFELVDLQRRGSARSPVLEVRVDRPGSEPGRGVTTEDCAAVTRALGAAWPGWHPGPAEPVFEVSSPGIERPVRFPEHWQRHVGRQVRVRSKLLPGKPVATIVALPDAAHVTLALQDGTMRTIGLDEIHEATLVFDWGAHGKRQG
jgi:ribosome maturation factor RimP